MPRRKPRSARSFHRAAAGGWAERLEKRIAEERLRAELTLVTRQLGRLEAPGKAANEGEGPGAS